jgi:hypothetical protein
MLFHIKYNVTPEQRDNVQQKFKKTGALPPDGVTMKGRWHSIEGNSGFIIAETSDIEAFGKWFQNWTDSLVFEVSPVLTDEQISKVIG